MHNLLGVEVLDGEAGLREDGLGAVLVQLAFGALEQLAQVAPVSEIHRDVQLAVIQKHLVQRDDVGVPATCAPSLSLMRFVPHRSQHASPPLRSTLLKSEREDEKEEEEEEEEEEEKDQDEEEEEEEEEEHEEHEEREEGGPELLLDHDLLNGLGALFDAEAAHVDNLQHQLLLVRLSLHQMRAPHRSVPNPLYLFVVLHPPSPAPPTPLEIRCSMQPQYQRALLFPEQRGTNTSLLLPHFATVAIDSLPSRF